MSINRGMDKEGAMHIDNGIPLSLRKMEIMPFAAAWRDLEVIILSEVSRRKVNTICHHLYVESSLKDKNEIISKTEIDLQT